MSKRRAHRLIAMVDVLLGMSEAGLTLTEWGRRVGLRRTPYLIALLNDLRDAQILSQYPRQQANGWIASCYFIAEGDRLRALAYCNALALASDMSGPEALGDFS